MGIPWYGELPERWETHKVSELFIERREKVSDKVFAPLSVSKGGIVPQIATVAKSNAGDDRKLVKKGDFAINSRSDRRGSSGTSQNDGSVSLINIVLTPRTETSEMYWHYLLKSHPFIEEYYRNGRGIVADLWTTRYSEMKTIYVPLPPRDEQDQIVCYLDWKVSQINKVINAKRKLVDLLHEQKRIVFSNAMKRNKNEWDSMRFRFLSKITTGNKDTINRIDDGEYPFYVRSPKVERINTFSYNGEAILMAGDGVGAGRVFHYVNGKFDYHQRVYCFYDFHKDIYPKYLYYYMAELFPSEIDKGTAKSTVDSIRLNMIQDFIISFPKINQQKNIVANLDRRYVNYESIATKLNDEITLFTEYRTRLISDVVTGKLDVRDVVVPEHNRVDDVTVSDVEYDIAEIMED